jgi:hypothetical protein
VFYRSLPAPEAPAGGLPPPLPGEARAGALAQPASGPRAQIILPLIDEHMVADPTWRSWLAQLAEAARATSPPGLARHLFPVALDSTAFNVPAPLRELNFLRPSAGLASTATSQSATEAAIRSLLKQVTEALCRLLLGRAEIASSGDLGAPKIKIFLSHAKGDGTTPARRLRDYIYSETQIAAFYDENDIPFGSAFARVLEADLGTEQTAALIAVRSARYASRPWCRREISLFRRPRRDPHIADHWRLSPVLVVDALDGETATLGVPEFGNSPIVRWQPGAAAQEGQIVNTLLRDALLCAVHSAAARAVPPAPNRIVLNWLPDPITLHQVLQQSRQGHAGPPPALYEIHHPGRGLSGLELDNMDDLFPDVVLRGFEELPA